MSDVAQEPSFGPAERKARTFILGGLLLVSCLLGFLLVKERTDILGKAFKNMFSASTTLLFREPFLVSLGVILVLLTFLGSVKSSQNQEHYSEEEE
ncbi:hypothetical protein AGMMS49949_04190 [Alphaproteobacteria bacterium]|nr:hypothetical protein AGMMS49949_04190 [Alphaproteobacteria bacterium]GHS97129.1 hypothetical protein AGMMS50296_3860 [Alphaproteobacteria bacterium]